MVEYECINNPQWFLAGSPSVVITATNFCPPNFSLTTNEGGWCNPPHPHFDMAFSIRVSYPSNTKDGDVAAMKVKGSQIGWLDMSRNWGQNWQREANLVGQALSIHFTTCSRSTLSSYNVDPPNWQFGQTFEGKQF